MPLTGIYTNDVQYLIEMGENAPLANDPGATNILPTLDSKGRPVIGFGYDILVHYDGGSGTLLGDLDAAGVVLTSAEQTALTDFLSNNQTVPYITTQLTKLQGLISLPTQADAVTLMQNSIAVVESKLTGLLTDSLKIANISPSNERAALVDMYYQLPGAKGQGGYFVNADGSLTNLSLALQSGNRAEAWFEIRYRSADDGKDGLGVVTRRYVDAQLFGLYADPGAPTETEALQAYQMLSANRSAIVAYERQFGSDPYGTDPEGTQASPSSSQIAAANQNYGLSGTANQVQTLAQAFDPAAEQEISDLKGLYGSVLPAIQVNDTASGGSSGFDVRSVDIYAASAADLDVDARVSDAPAAEATADESANHVLLGNETGDTLTGALGNDILVAGAPAMKRSMPDKARTR